MTGAMGTAALVAATPAPAGAACLPQWETTVDVTVWENKTWTPNPDGVKTIPAGRLVTNHYGDFSSDGWTPVTYWAYKQGEYWYPILSPTNPNDTKDFIRTSGLTYRGCS